MNHPDDERLAALAGHDPEADADRELAAHVADCARCADVVTEIGALRASLAELPDLEPPRPLRLLPAADAEPAAGDRIGAWVRRFFAPLVTAGAALALVGAVGTAVPALDGMAASGGADAQGEQELAVPDHATAGGAEDGEEPRLMNQTDEAAAPGAEAAQESDDGTAERLSRDDEAFTSLPAERSPWPMVLFAGVAVLVGTLLLRWILAPRAG